MWEPQHRKDLSMWLDWLLYHLLLLRLFDWHISRLFFHSVLLWYQWDCLLLLFGSGLLNVLNFLFGLFWFLLYWPLLNHLIWLWFLFFLLLYLFLLYFLNRFLLFLLRFLLNLGLHILRHIIQQSININWLDRHLSLSFPLPTHQPINHHSSESIRVSLSFSISLFSICDFLFFRDHHFLVGVHDLGDLDDSLFEDVCLSESLVQGYSGLF